MPTKKKTHKVTVEVACDHEGNPRTDTVDVPKAVIEALLVANSQSNKTAADDVCNQIREIAEQQGWAQF